MKKVFNKVRKIYKKEKQGFILLISGILLLSIYSGWRFHQVRILSFNAREIAKIVSSTGIKPTYIKIYPIGVDVAIKETVIKDGVWVIQPSVASYLVSSAGIGDKGNMIIYGHNKDNILGPIRYIAIGAKIELKGSDGKTYYYEVVKTDTVNPDNLEYIQPKSEEVLTLYTCTGFLDSKRFIVVAKRIGS
jgi:LPXTG-site transpeptidase (sortase) family protein